MRSAYFELEEVAPGQVLARFKLLVPASEVTPVFPAGCSVVSRSDGPPSDGVAPQLYRLACRAPLRGARVRVEGLGGTIPEAVVLALFRDGTSASHLLTGGAEVWEIPEVDAVWPTLREYVRLGVEHILLGADHLLFLALLVLILQRARSVLLAETAFTLSHTASFTATALGLVRIPAAAAEACIALSLVLLALDVGRPERRPTDRVAAALAFGFGLVHGLGFAGALREIGVPEGNVMVALAGFGLGVELGQVAFLLAVLGAVSIAQRAPWYGRAVSAGTYAIGGVASYWLIERVWVCLQWV